ncbi:sigma-70 family RNA polymerase sigma factor [Allokutzneria oryzae]|uniref:RNA polymerase sigma factor n=1 Tax=Allokutzneria oryzae TaxID=1378989 RepID=A0ABV5ZRK1_9PSEU
MTVTSGTLRQSASAPEPDLVRRYLNQVGSTPLLTAEQEVDLAKRIEAGVYAEQLLPAATGERADELRVVADQGRAAMDHMVRANLRLVVSIAKKYTYHEMPFLDLVQEGNLGLIHAVKKFDYAKGYKFSTYATWWIRQAITRGVAEQGRTVRLPVHVVEQLSKVRRVERQLGLKLNRDPSVEEIAEEADVAPERVAELRRIGRSVVSLETPIGEDGDTVFGDLLEDSESASAQELVEHQQFAARLRELVDSLPARQARIMTLRYGLDDGRQRTLQEVADELGLTRERIRQLEKESMRWLREPEHCQPLRAWAS